MSFFPTAPSGIRTAERGNLTFECLGEGGEVEMGETEVAYCIGELLQDSIDGDRLPSVDGDTQRSSGTPRLVCEDGIVDTCGDAVVTGTEGNVEGDGELQSVCRCSRSMAGLVSSSNVYGNLDDEDGIAVWGVVGITRGGGVDGTMVAVECECECEGIR